MIAFTEAIIIYMVLFLAGVRLPGPVSGAVNFSAVRELNRFAVYNIPALALIWYALIREGGALPRLKPRPRDFGWAALGLTGLAAAAWGLGLGSAYFASQGIRYETPASAFSWCALVLSSFSTGYMEESYFRVYFFSRFGEAHAGFVRQLRAVFFSTALFALSHLYEGLWGFLNSIIAGFFLFYLYVKTRSFHGIAWAHGLYNILVYGIAAFEKYGGSL